MEDLIGKRIDNYEITGLIGFGGMAYVYRAIESTPNIERPVALKLIRSDIFPSNELPVLRKRFLQQAQIMDNLAHPHIAKVFGSGNCEYGPYIVMELIEGETLQHLLGTPFPYKKAAEILIPIADALFNLHQQQKVHRDVKPSNIMIRPDGFPILMDFSIAKSLEDTKDNTILTNIGVTVGTPAYMAPEQIFGDEIDGRADEYALGVVFFEMITGRKLYNGNTPTMIMMKHIRDEIPSARAINPEIPEEVDQLIHKVLAKGPNDRFPTIEDFAEELRKLAGQPVRTPQAFFNEDQSKYIESQRNEFAATGTSVSPLPNREEESLTTQVFETEIIVKLASDREVKNYKNSDVLPQNNAAEKSKITSAIKEKSPLSTAKSKRPYWLVVLILLVIAVFFAVRYFSNQNNRLSLTETVTETVIIPTGTPERLEQDSTHTENIS